MSPVRSFPARLARRVACSTRRRTLLLFCAVVAVGASACTPDEITAYLKVTATGTQQAEARGFTGEQAAKVRYCESLNQYDFVNGPGKIYRGAYQFTQGTWDNAAAKWYPWLVGHDPAQEPWYWQDAMARAVWADNGSQPWSACVGPNTWCAAWDCTAGKEPR